MLRVVYRSYGGENWKNRPAYYSKRLALLSFLRALRTAEAEVLFVNDGPVQDDLVELMRPVGEVLQLPRMGMRGSYVYGLRLPFERGWPEQDVVWFSEDDYLYRPEAFARLSEAAQDLPQADYFALYGATQYTPNERLGHELPPLPRGWHAPAPSVAGGHEWVRMLSTASTFGGRAGALRADHGVFRFCMVPHRNMYRDHDTCVVLQGFEPHAYGPLLRQLVLAGEGGLRDRLRAAWLAPFLLATNLRAHRRPEHRRLYLAAKPNLATHLESDKLSPGTDWAQVAADVEAWALAEGLVDAASEPSAPAGRSE